MAFASLSDSALEFEIFAWFATTDVDEFRDLREAVLTGFLQVIEKSGTRLAHPTRTVRLAQ